MVILDTILLIALLAFTIRFVLSLSPCGGLLLVLGFGCLFSMALLIAMGSVLLLLDVYNARTVMACSVLLSLGICVALEHGRQVVPIKGLRSWRLEVPLAGFLFVGAVLIASPGYEISAMGSDAGVYVNRALQINYEGALFPRVGIDAEQLPNELRRRYTSDNIRTAGFHRPVLEDGAKLRTVDGDWAIEFHALPAWPVLLAVSAHVAGVENLLTVSVVILFALVALIYAAVMALAGQPLLAAATATTTLCLPIVAYFSRYPTAELFLALVTLGIASSFICLKRMSGVVAGLLAGIYSLVHVSGFVLLIMACGYAIVFVPLMSKRARSCVATFLVTAGIGHFIAFNMSRYASGGYVADLLAVGFGSEMAGRWAMFGIAALAVVIAVGLHLHARGRHE